MSFALQAALFIFAKGEKMNSIKGFILYIDILGYKELLRNNENQDHTRTKELLEQFTEIYSTLNFALGFGAYFNKSKLFKRFFSDNFLFVYEAANDDATSLATIQSIASQIQTQFLLVGMLTRGSITYGEIFYNDEIVYGCDLIKAVEFENHPEPSIIVDKVLENVLIAKGYEYSEHNCIFSVQPNSSLDCDEIIKGIKKYLLSLNKTNPSEKIIDKIRWIIEQLNKYFVVLGKEYYLSKNVEYTIENGRK